MACDNKDWRQLAGSMTGPLIFPGDDQFEALAIGHIRQLLHGHGTGRAYQNFSDPELADPLVAYYGQNLPRLRKVKHRYDPDDVFHHSQSILPMT